ncbi:MAG: BatD family protein [Candidatus Aureabacteria bacterium]|nr:BatD family protein [Candidatus Auribacterota bacterium]
MQHTSYSTQIEIVNGVTSSSTQYDYVLTPIRAGKLSIGPVTLAQGGATYQSQPITVEVGGSSESAAAASHARPKPGGDGGGQGAQPSNTDPMFIELSVDKPEVYLHEQLILTFRFYCSSPLAERAMYEPPAAEGCVAKILRGGESTNYTRLMNGRRYQVSEVKTALFPFQTGELTLGPARLKGAVLIETARRQRQPGSPFDLEDIFQDPFFGRFGKQPFELSSNQVKVRVLPLPAEGAPKGQAAVGHYTLKVEAKPAEVHAGDPVTMTMTVRGEGDLDAVPAPHLKSTDGFKTYDATGAVEMDKGGDRIAGVKRFEQAIVPLKESIREIPEIQFPCFDPADRKYVMLHDGPIPIKVLPPREGARIVSFPSGGEGRGVKLLERNIVFIKTDPGLLSRGGGNGLSVLFWPAQILPLLCVIAAYLHARHRDRLRSDLGYARLYHSGKKTRARLVSAEAALRKEQSEEFYAALMKAVNTYIADRLNIPSGGLTAEIIQERLREKRLQEELLRRLDEFARNCEMARFAPVESGRADMEQAYREATELLEALRRCRF